MQALFPKECYKLGKSINKFNRCIKLLSIVMSEWDVKEGKAWLPGLTCFDEIRKKEIHSMQGKQRMLVDEELTIVAP
eukprot:scaffold297330_cov10-Tisochrysis_lutea.AAC.1